MNTEGFMKLIKSLSDIDVKSGEGENDCPMDADDDKLFIFSRFSCSIFCSHLKDKEIFAFMILFHFIFL
jgi:hypothetical protein